MLIVKVLIGSHIPGGHAWASLKLHVPMSFGTSFRPYPRRTRLGLIEAAVAS